jgi:hypothetical protein
MADRVRVCEICGATIEAERVEAVPETRLCIDHAKAIQKYGGEFLLTSRRVSLGKDGSMKKNYGDVSSELRRNEQAMQKLRDEYHRHGRAE